MKVKKESEKVGLKLNIQKTKIMASGPITSWQIDRGNSGNSVRLYFWRAPKSLQMVIAAMKLKDACCLEEKLWPTAETLLCQQGPSSQSYGFSSSHIWLWELYYKESWAPKNWCFWTVVLEKTLESPLDGEEIQPINPKWNPNLYPLLEAKGMTEDEMVG